MLSKKLIMVSENNNNKFYDMVQVDDFSWTCRWGRVGTNGQTKTYPMSQWNKKLQEKLKKGYEDVTDIVAITKVNENIDFSKISNEIADELKFLKETARQTISRNYTVSSEQVTEKQIEEAQKILNELISYSSNGNIDIKFVNSKLLDLFKVIPRKMKKTKDHLLSNVTNKEKMLKDILSREQDLLDVMESQVIKTSVINIDSNNPLDDFEFSMPTKDDLDRISKETDLIVTKVPKIIKVKHIPSYEKYEKLFKEDPNANEKLLYHGSRNENWWSILNSGLKIRPSNAIHTGSMFGNGIYWANKARKSIGYTSLRGSFWAGGSANTGYISLFKVNLGRVWDLFKNGNYKYSYSNLTNSKVKNKGYDSVFACKGADLRNDEYIVYEEGRCTIEFLIKLSG